jgi:hypothetical protein
MTMKTTTQKNAAVLAVSLLAFLPLHAGGAGTSGANFLKVGVGARSLAMAGAAVSTVDDANAIYWNPARLAPLTQTSLTATYASLFEDQSQGFLGAATPLGDHGVLGLGVNYLTVADIEKRAGDTESADSMFKDQEYSVALSYARKGVLWDSLDLGANAKLIQQSLDTYKESAYAVDLGAAYRATEKITAGLTVQNLGSDLGEDSLPVLVKAGADVRLFQSKLSLALDGDAWVTDERYTGSAGTEFWLAKPLALRAGYRFGQGPDNLGGASGLSVGVGFHFSSLSLDYAFLPSGDLGDTHRMSFGARF